jgi:TRAP-type C4-dicarboxylate transport system permease small subunit
MTERRFQESGPLWLMAVVSAILAGIALSGLALVTIADVIMRTMNFNLFSGMIEISNLGVLCLGFFALPYCFIVGGHIVVDFATAAAPDGFNRRIDGLWNLVAAVFLAAAAVSVMQNAIATHEAGERSATLQWSPLVFQIPAVVGMVLAALICAWLGLRAFAGRQPAEN